MSEWVANIPPAPPPATPKDAAGIILVRKKGSGIEVLWLKRHPGLDFAGGFYAFPGGKVDASDAQVPVEGAKRGESAFCVAAARELFEETGIFLGHGPPVAREILESRRKSLLAGQIQFGDVLKELGCTLRQEDFRPAGRSITPEHSPRRFDARFFLVEATESARAEVWPGEIESSAWISPGEALGQWQSGEALLYPPQLHAFRALERFTTADDAARELESERPDADELAEFQGGIRCLPLRTPTLPPATHTNCYILGNKQLLVVDPGATNAREHARLIGILERLKAEGKQPVAVVLTHHHQDHIGSVGMLKERLKLPLWCHELTATRVGVPADRLLREGEVLNLDGAPSMRSRVLYTPGHARGHVCLVDERSRATIVGDMVAGMGTIVIDPPEGDMADYLKQLARLRDFPVGALYPAHGPPCADGPRKLEEYLRHRQMREDKVLRALASGPRTFEELVPLAYDDVPKAIHPVAARNTEAILIKLQTEGKAYLRGDKYLHAK